MASWRLALQEVPSHLLSDQEKEQIATQIIINQKYIEEAVNDLISVIAPIGYDALATALRNLIPKTYESRLRPCTNGSLGSLLKNRISLHGALRNLCAPVESNHGVLAADLCEPIQKLQEDGGYADWKITHLQDVLNCLAGKTHVQGCGNVDEIDCYLWYCDELDKMFEAYPETIDQFDPSFLLVNFPADISHVFPPFPPPPVDLQVGQQWVQGNLVGNRQDFCVFAGNNAARNKESRAAFMATVLGLHPNTTFFAFDLAHLPVLHP